MKLLLLSFFICFVLILEAKEPLSLEACVSFALEHNLSLKSQQYDVLKQRLHLANAKQQFLPAISANSYYNERFGRSIDPETNTALTNQFFTSGFGINASLSLFEGFRRSNRIKLEKNLLESERAGIQKAEDWLTFQIIELYSNALFYQGIIDVIREQVDLSYRLLKRQRRMVELGQKSLLDLTDVEAQMAEDSLELERYEMEMNLAFHSLRKAMNYSLDEELELEVFQLQVVEAQSSNCNPVQVMLLAEKHLPQIRILEGQLKSAGLLLKETKASLWPSLTLNIGVSSAYNETTHDPDGETMSFSKQLDVNSGSYVGVNLSIPLFSRWCNHTNVKLAKLNNESAKQHYEEMWQQLRFDVYENTLLLGAALARYKAGIKNEAKQQMAFTNGEKRLENGLISTLDFYALENSLTHSKIERLRLSIELFLQYKTIEYYVSGTIM
ncbi:TolC family protein [Mangrovibacterium sp.]|uniref:TolC family protein n=1 Tax=Mangrovibacterium sp. TaxID=1961364 RepID=UPI0035623C80